MKNTNRLASKNQLQSQVIFIPAIPSVRSVLKAIISCSDLSTLTSHARIDTLSRISKLSRSTVKRALDTLTSMGLISRRKRYRHDYRTNNQARQISSEIKLIIPTLMGFIGKQLSKLAKVKNGEPQTRPTNRKRSFSKKPFVRFQDKNATAFHAYAAEQGKKHDRALEEAKQNAVSSARGLEIIARLKARFHI